MSETTVNLIKLWWSGGPSRGVAGPSPAWPWAGTSKRNTPSISLGTPPPTRDSAWKCAVLLWQGSNLTNLKGHPVASHGTYGSEGATTRMSHDTLGGTLDLSRSILWKSGDQDFGIKRTGCFYTISFNSNTRTGHWEWVTDEKFEPQISESTSIVQLYDEILALLGKFLGFGLVTGCEIN